MPGRENQATKKGEEVAVKTGATIDREVHIYTRCHRSRISSPMYLSRLTTLVPNSPRLKRTLRSSPQKVARSSTKCVKRPARNCMRQLATLTRLWSERLLRQRKASQAGSDLANREEPSGSSTCRSVWIFVVSVLFGSRIEDSRWPMYST